MSDFHARSNCIMSRIIWWQNLENQKKYATFAIRIMEEAKVAYLIKHGFEAETIFKTDPVKSWFEYGKKQECCKQYDWVVKGTRLWKDKNMHISTNDFISQSDYWLGDPKTKSPLIVIGTETARKMKKFDFFCIYFDNVMG